MESKIEIADLVKPKFEPRSMVYVVRRDRNGLAESVKRVMIERVRFSVTFYADTPYNGYKQMREAKLVYDLLNEGEAHEESLFATLDEIKEQA